MEENEKELSLFERLSIFASALSEREIYVTSQEILPKNLRRLSPRVALTDGQRIYLPKPRKGLKQEKQEEFYRQQCLEKIVEIEKRETMLEEGRSGPDFRDYENPAAASVIYQLLENTDNHTKAKERFPNAYQETRDDYEILRNFAVASRKARKNRGTKMRRDASRHTRLVNSGKSNPEISEQYTKKIYNAFKDKKRRKLPNLGDLFSEFSIPMLGQGENPMQVDLEQIGEARDQLLGGLSAESEMKGSALERLIDQKIAKSGGGGAGPSQLRNLQNDIRDQLHERDKIHNHPSTILYQIFVEDYGYGYDEFLQKFSGQIQAVKRVFERLKGEENNKLRRQISGDKIDIDAAIDAMISLRNGEEPEEKIYVDIKRKRRDVYVGLLLDISGSTADDNKIYHIRNSAAILAEALEHIGDRYMIYAFESDSLHLVKPLGDENPLSRRKIFSLNEGGGTPQADATRDMTNVFNNIDARTKILITISDGKPNHNQDTRGSLLEAKLANIRPYSVTVDEHGEDYLKKLFGNTPYVICKDALQLPQKLVNFYRQIAF